MSIWKTKVSLKMIADRSKNTMVDHLGIEFTEVSDHFLIARMPVDHRTRQTMGIMHGGASCVLAETVGSTAANFCVDQSLSYCVGLDINTNHIRAAKSGWVTAKATPFHVGKMTQVWNIEIRNDAEELISITRLTMAVLNK